ncbi:hypothetical protein IEE_05487 [Bacillus cereus BAG5X1-1]|uniref:Uncharacterized protein n=1 Tax=Bacillus cereus BAG5X1-1 TaxID=1053189 RepID=J7ZHV8_BACCE|nr:hypothetical protein [Bacillus cereus]EJQ36011.1 hypothetical protein IEE_05487 [Bacillus cereus BAG5X1-1]
MYCEEELFKKVIVPPEEEFKDLKIKPASYLIQHLGLSNFLLRRELEAGEEVYPEDDILVYEEKTYVWLTDFPSEEDAMRVIRLNWDATKQLNKFEQSGSYNQ